MIQTSSNVSWPRKAPAIITSGSGWGNKQLQLRVWVWWLAVQGTIIPAMFISCICGGCVTGLWCSLAMHTTCSLGQLRAPGHRFNDDGITHKLTNEQCQVARPLTPYCLNSSLLSLIASINVSLSLPQPLLHAAPSMSKSEIEVV